MFREPALSHSGLYVVDWQHNFVNWLAWATWLFAAFNKKSLPQRLTVTGPWPPIDGSGAADYATKLKEWRETASKETAGKSVWVLPPPTAHPPVWQPWPFDEMKRIEAEEAKRREEGARLFTQRPAYSWDK